MRNSVFPLPCKVGRRASACCGKSVEAFWPPLTPEHGFPSLFCRPGPRALPLSPLPVVPGAPDVVFADAHPFRLKVKNSGRLRGCPPCRMLIHNFLRWHYPHQVKGQDLAGLLSAREGSPVFVAFIMTPPAGICQAVSCVKICPPIEPGEKFLDISRNSDIIIWLAVCRHILAPIPNGGHLSRRRCKYGKGFCQL